MWVQLATEAVNHVPQHRMPPLSKAALQHARQFGSHDLHAPSVQDAPRAHGEELHEHVHGHISCSSPLEEGKCARGRRRPLAPRMLRHVKHRQESDILLVQNTGLQGFALERRTPSIRGVDVAARREVCDLGEAGLSVGTLLRQGWGNRQDVVADRAVVGPQTDGEGRDLDDLGQAGIPLIAAVLLGLLAGWEQGVVDPVCRRCVPLLVQDVLLVCNGMHHGAQATTSCRLRELVFEAVDAPEQILAAGRLALAMKRDACGASCCRGQRLANDGGAASGREEVTTAAEFRQKLLI
mmetsp:Transcript_99498/g.319284  ORF Transcript_99498/g.319284 Transcript_99498/m.319284 type:complete len:295 (-) Transcript_99498:159-1043(-)